MDAARDEKPFVLGDLNDHGPLLISDGYVFLRLEEPQRWCEIGPLDCLEELDRAKAQTRLEPDEAALANSSLESRILRQLPENARRFTASILTFVLQAERYRHGAAMTSLQSLVLGSACGSQRRLAPLLLGNRLVLLYRGIFFVPRQPMSGGAPLDDQTLLMAFHPAPPVTLEMMRQSYEVRTGPQGLLACMGSDLRQEVESAAGRIEESVAKECTHLGKKLLYECEETSLYALADPQTGQPTFAIASDPWVVEDSDGELYRMDGFTLGVQCPPDGQGSRLMTTPSVIDPRHFEHWHPSPLHMCTYVPDRPVENPLQIDNCISVLLSGLHLLRAGLFGPPRIPPRLRAVFGHRIISREDAEEQMLPIYPFRRT